MGGRVPAYLILPPNPGKHPAVLFLHPGQGSRSTFLDEAVALAKDRGMVSLTISAPFLRPENQGKRGGNPWNPEVSRREQIQTIVRRPPGLRSPGVASRSGSPDTSPMSATVWGPRWGVPSRASRNVRSPSS